MKPLYSPIGLIAGAALVIIVGDTLFYRAKRPAGAARPAEPVTTKVEPAERMHIRGPVDAPVTVEEFADFECGPCGRLAGIIKQVQADAGTTLRVIFRHYPLSIHSNSQLAALAAEAAGMQGRFWEMHDLLFSEQSTWSGATEVQTIFQGYAQRLELDMNRFIQDSAGADAAARIAADRERATRRGVSQTPTVFINDWVVPRYSYSGEGLRSRIDMMEATVTVKPTGSPSATTTQ